MNLSGISDSTSTTKHFWIIAVPVTVGIVILCSVVALKGEDVFFAFASIPRLLKGTQVGVGNGDVDGSVTHDSHK